MGISRVILWISATAVLLIEVSSSPSGQSVRGKRSGASGHEEFWSNTKFMDNLGEYLASNEEPKVRSHVPKPIKSSNAIKSANTPAAFDQRAEPSINRPNPSSYPQEIASTSWNSYHYPSKIQQRPYVPSPIPSSLQRSQSQNTSPVNFRPSNFNSKSDHEASESILIPAITMYTAFKSLVGLATPSPAQAFSNLIIAKPYPTEEAATAPSATVNAVTFQPPTQQPPPPQQQIAPVPTSAASSSGSNPKEHKVLVFHLPPDMPIPPAFLQSNQKSQNSTTQHVYFQRPQQPSPPPQVQQAPLSYIIGENRGSQFSQPQQSVQVPLTEAFSSQISSGPIVSNVPYPLPVYSNYNPYTSASSSVSSLPSFQTVNVENFAASGPQPQRQPYVPDQQNAQSHQSQHQYYPPTPFPIAIPHSHEQLAQFSNPNILIATAAPVTQQPPAPQGTASSSSGFLEEENEVDKKPVGQQQANMMGNLAEWIETGRKIMYFPKGVVDVVDKAVSYAEHNPYMGLVMDTVADKIFGSTKPLSGLTQQLQLAISQQGTQKQQGSQAV